MVWRAATLFAVNGTVSKVVVDSVGLSTLELWLYFVAIQRLPVGIADRVGRRRARP